MGVDVHRLGVCPTPALSFVTGDLGYGAGIMVSASHNPADDNGLKVLDGRGLKLDDESEDDLEALLWRADELPSPTNSGIGREIDGRPGLDRYREHRLALARRTASDLRVTLDCANGSGGELAPGHPGRDRGPGQRLFRRPRRQQHQPRLRRDGARGAGRSSRRRRDRTPASPSTATRTGVSPSTSGAPSWTATSCWASSPSTGWPDRRWRSRRWS